MSTTLTGIAPPAHRGRSSPRADRQHERLFFSGMAIALALVVFVGFAPSYYLRSVSDVPNSLSPSLHLHGLVFTAWMVLLIVQTALIAGRRPDLHRQLGAIGVGLAAGMVLIGWYVSVTRTRIALTADIQGIPPFVLLAIGLFGMVVFAALIGAAVYFRRRADVHKRLMLIATLELATAGIARLPFVAPYGPVAFFGVADLFLVSIIVYDLVTLKRIHAATLWGGLALVVSQPLRLLIAGTGAWTTFAAWLTA